MRNQKQQGNNTPTVAPYQLMLPLDVEVKIDTGESVRLLLEITERMDYSTLTATYDRHPRADEASPKQMFQLVLLGFMEGDYSTRKLKKACNNDIRYMYVLRGKPAPSAQKPSKGATASPKPTTMQLSCA